MLGSANTRSGWAARLLLAGGLFLLSAAAQAQIRYIASTGNDGHACTSAAAPCRTLQRGINAVPAGGEVRILDSGSYGLGIIGKSLTISADAATVIGRMRINNTSAVVALRDLNLSGAGGLDVGIYVIAASAVHIERCTVERFTDDGILSTGPNVEVFVTDSISRDNGSAGLNIQDANVGSTRLVVDNSRFLNNGEDGVLIYRIAATFTHSTSSGNRANGISASDAAAIFKDTIASENELGAGYALYESKAALESSVSRGNSLGLLALAGDETLPLVTISNSVFVNNREQGILAVDAPIRTRGNNTVAGNGTDIDGTLTPLAGE
jgi:hypothetical protein